MKVSQRNSQKKIPREISETNLSKDINGLILFFFRKFLLFNFEDSFKILFSEIRQWIPLRTSAEISTVFLDSFLSFFWGSVRNICGDSFRDSSREYSIRSCKIYTKNNWTNSWRNSYRNSCRLLWRNLWKNSSTKFSEAMSEVIPGKIHEKILRNSLRNFGRNSGSFEL